MKQTNYEIYFKNNETMDVNKDWAQANSTCLYKPKRYDLILIIRDCYICVSQFLAMCGDIFIVFTEGEGGTSAGGQGQGCYLTSYNA